MMYDTMYDAFYHTLSYMIRGIRLRVDLLSMN